MNKEIKIKMHFDYWFNRTENMDLRTPIACKLTFIEKLTIEEWKELIKYVFNKCQEAQTMWKR